MDFLKRPDESIHNIVTKKKVGKEAGMDIVTVEQRGQLELEQYIRNRLGANAKEPVWAPIKRLNLKMFSTPLKKSKDKIQVEGLKKNHAFFARCAILLNRNRGIDMEEVIRI